MGCDVNYFDKPGLSFHALKDLGTVSPEYYYRANVTKEIMRLTNAGMSFGTAVHAVILEPDSYPDLVTICPPEHLTPSGELSTKKETKAWRESLGHRACILSPFDDARCRHIAAKVRANKYAVSILKDAITESEHTCEIAPGVTVKAKVDLIDTGRKVWDLKTIKSLDSIKDHARDFAYLEQIDWYAAVLTRSTGMKYEPGGLLVVESEEPHRVAIVTAGAWIYAEARKRWLSWLDRYCECQMSGVWPNDPTEPIVISSFE